MFFGSAEFRASMIFGFGALACSLGPRPKARQLRPFNAGFGSPPPHLGAARHQLGLGFKLLGF